MAAGGHLQPTAIASAADALQLQTAHAHMAAAAAGQLVAAQPTGPTALLPAMHAAAPSGATAAHHIHHHHPVQGQGAGAGQLQPSATAALFVATANIAPEFDLKDLFTRYRNTPTLMSIRAS